MAIEVFNRKEIKYLITKEQFDSLLPEINKYMNADKYNLGGKTYSIHNLYYDTNDDFLISTSLAKPVYKQKLRLRSYGCANLDSTVYLEIKKKYKGIVNKRRTAMTLKQAYEFNNVKDVSNLDNINQQVLNEIKYLFKLYPDLKPKVFLSYDRFAFFEKNNNDFRLTFDNNICTRRIDLQLEKDAYGEKLLDLKYWVMEAKAFNAFPLWFVQLLSRTKIYNTSFSKYGREYLKYSSRMA